MNLKHDLRQALKTQEVCFTHHDYAYLAKQYGRKLKSVANACRELVKEGALVKVSRIKNGHGGSPMLVYKVIDVSKLDKDSYDAFKPMTPQQRVKEVKKHEQELMKNMDNLQLVLDKITREHRA